MSQYLKFVLERAGAPPFPRIRILPYQEEWANRQMVDEFQAAFPGTEIALTPEAASAGPDLIVLPHMYGFLEEHPGGLDLYRKLSASRGAWVMLYGLDYRRIKVLPAEKLLAYYRWAILVRKLEWWLAKAHVTGVIRRTRRLREWLCE